MADCHSIFLTLLQSIPKPTHGSFSSQTLPQFLLCSALRHYRSRRRMWKQPASCPLNVKTAPSQRGGERAMPTSFAHLVHEREPIERVRARLDALAKANAAP